MFPYDCDLILQDEKTILLFIAEYVERDLIGSKSV